MTRLHTIPQDPFFVGLDRIFDRMHASNLTDKQQNYPPYNIIKTDDYAYVIELALAGFTEDQLDITVEDGVLHVTGDPLDSINVTIPTRVFQVVSSNDHSRLLIL